MFTGHPVKGTAFFRIDGAMDKQADRKWTKPELKVVGTLRDVAGNGSSNCQGNSGCSHSFS